MAASVKLVDNKLVITVDIQPKSSLTDKGNRIVASTGGFRSFDTQYKGKDIRVNVVAMVEE